MPKISTFVYYVQDLAPFFNSFIERLMSQLALNGTAITDQQVEEDLAKMKVRYMDESGNLVAAPVGNDIKVIYEVTGGGTLMKGLWGAITGGGIASLLSGLIDGDKDRLLDVISGAVAGGAYGLADGFNTALEDATEFSKMLARAIRDVEEQLREIKYAQEEAGREKREELKRLENELEEAFAEAVSLGDEIDLMEVEGKDVSKAKVRYERAIKLLDEAKDAIKRGDEMMARAKIRSARNMVERARELLM
ncbi:MAG: hypothetical protein J7L91_05235 [Candidatus Korarchaeota archaeon]|nr:hypothetical protein [Candidatus Korarchaeota archaeon]